MNNLTGQIFGRLTVLKFIEKTRRRVAIYECRCECGQIKKVQSNTLKSGQTKSCGCLHKETVRLNEKKRTIGYGVAAANGVILMYKQAAKDRNLDWALTKDEAIQLMSKECYYCGAAPTQRKITASDTGIYIHNGIDRVNNSIGYILTNCVPCCKFCNYAKRNVTKDEFFAHIKRIYDKHKEEIESGYKIIYA